MRLTRLVSAFALAAVALTACENSPAPTALSDVDSSALQPAKHKGKQSGPGKVAVGVDASVWDSDLAGSCLAPIGGSGQINGEFTTAERLGIQIGLRAQERFAGTLPATPNKNGKIGIYQAETGFSSGTRATWNYDWHVDLRNAKGVAKGTTMDDYDVILDTDMFTTLFGIPIPGDLSAGLDPCTVLFQQSWNPDFGNAEFNPTVPATYYVRLTLVPTTFNGAPLAVEIQVDVVDP